MRETSTSRAEGAAEAGGPGRGSSVPGSGGTPARRGGGRLRIGLKEGVALAVIIAVVVAFMTGAVDLDRIEDFIKEIGPTLGAWAYPLVGALAFLETAALIGLVAPGELTVVIGGLVAAQGGVNVVAIFLVAWLCAFSGDMASYFLGRRLGRPFLEKHGPRLGISLASLEKAESMFERHGGKMILIGRFISLVRALAPFLAGVSKMSPVRFAAVDVVGAGLWAGAFTALGYVAAANIDRALDVAAKGKLVLGALIALGIVVVIVRRARKGGPVPEAAAVPVQSGNGGAQ